MKKQKGDFIKIVTGLLENIVFILILVAFILASPVGWRQKLPGIVWGGVTIASLNLVRIVTLAIIGSKAPGYFKFLHIYFWQVTAIAMIGGVFLVWFRWAQRRSA